MQHDTLRIKKYANRRLYDTEQSRYITLSELAETVRGGRRVDVVDAKTGESLTRQVLVQVILEEQERLDLLPIELLHHVIKVQGTAQASATATFLSQSLTQFMGVGEQWSRAVGPTGKAWMDMAGAALRGFTDPFPATPAAADDAPPPPDGDPPETPPAGDAEETGETDLAADVAALKDQMAGLMRALQGK
jgi:polyhydroxyalkanoate synthesis repressor PhaR